MNNICDFGTIGCVCGILHARTEDGRWICDKCASILMKTDFNLFRINLKSKFHNRSKLTVLVA